MGETNQEWVKEQERVNDVIEVIEKKQTTLQGDVGGLKENIIELRKNFWEDITVNMDEPDDVIETHTSLRQQAELLAERERTHGGTYQKLKTLERLKENPYFGRIDFKEEIEPVEQIYLGIASLMNEEESDFLIYDWRAPISSLYYDFSPGQATYQTPSGKIDGEITLKRQFIIRQGVIKGLFDTGITIGDQLLQEVLSNQSNQQMKSIVATIQKEQNQIIRNTKASLLVVQGAAGSGKTSAALQRMAYLLYRFRESLKTSNMLLFSPNPLFNSYVSTVLPELGEENITQTTFLQYLEQHIGSGLTIESPFEQMEMALNSYKIPSYQIRVEGIRFKATLLFKDRLDHYIKSLSDHGLVFKPLIFRGKEVVSKETMVDYFYSLPRDLTLSNRMEAMAEWLYQETRKEARIERDKEWVEEAIGLLSKETYAKVHHKLQKKKGRLEDSFDDLEREELLLKKLVVNQHFKKIRRQIKELKFINLKAIYINLFQEYKVFSPSTPENWEAVCDASIQELENGRLFYEDATPFLYLKEKLEGRKKQLAVRHVFIDEAQDYTPFQMAFIKELFPVSKLTVLGDFSQAIFPHTLNMKTLLEASQFGLEDQERIELSQSYRSTREITEFTKSLLVDPTNIVPFNRHGEKPTVVESVVQSEHLSQLSACINDIKQRGHQTIAIICKTAEESQMAFDQLKGSMPVQLMTEETATFTKGILVLPSYLAKGIEFDAVIIFNASNDQYGDESVRRLFYTACTRAMHELHLLSVGKVTRFLDGVDPNLFVKK
jgi:DNA helicase II / ATP-dependent DNA helicase PcrA